MNSERPDKAMQQELVWHEAFAADLYAGPAWGVTRHGKADRAEGVVQARLVAAWQRWLVIVLIMFVLLAAVFVAFQPLITEFVYERLLAGRLEQRYGFRGGRAPLAHTSGGEGAYVLVEVTAGGPLERAGFRAGDAPFGAFHSNSVYFIQLLSTACETPGSVISVAQVGDDGGLDLSSSRTLQIPCAR